MRSGHPGVERGSFPGRIIFSRAIGPALLLVVYAISPGAISQERTLYRSEAIILVEELNDCPAEDREIVLENLRSRLRDWSVLRSAVKQAGGDDRRGSIRRAVDAGIVEDDRFRIWLDHDNPVECRRILSALTERIASEGLEAGESDRLAFLRDRLDEVRERARDADRRLDDFVREHDQVLSEEKIAGKIVGDKIRLEKCLIEMEEANARKRALTKKLDKTPEYIVASTVVEYGPEVMKIKRAIAKKEERLEYVRSRYGEGSKTAKLERGIGDLRLKLGVFEKRANRKDTRSLNLLYRDIEAELAGVADRIQRLGYTINRMKEHVEENERIMKETADLRIEKRKLDRKYSEMAVLLDALQNKLEEEFARGRLDGGELEVKIIVGPTKPAEVKK